MKIRQLFLFLAMISALTGCGQPGPLYLPGTAPPIHVEPEPKPEPTSEPEKNK
jgi:predicted small lipoprotein YifL